MSEQPEFAEEYSRVEKLRLVVLYLAVGAAAVLGSKLWLFPGIRTFAASAPCREVLGVPGVQVLFYGLLVFMPLALALVIGLTIGRRGYRILRDGQLPPAGEKAFRPTRIERGRKAKVMGYAHMLAPLLLVAIAIWGVPRRLTFLTEHAIPRRREDLSRDGHRPVQALHARRAAPVR